MSSNASPPSSVVLVSDAVDVGGAEISLIDLAQGLGGAYNVVCLLAEHAPDELVRRLRATGARVELVDGLRRRPTPAAVARLVRRVRRAAPAVVHLNLTDQGDLVSALLAARLWDVPTVATLRCVVPARAAWRERVSAAALGRMDLAIGASNFARSYLDGLGLRALEIRNGVPVPQPAPNAREQLGVTNGQFVVGGVGRLHESKGWDVLCRAAERVRDAVPGASFVVLGDGPERKRLERMADGSAVRFLGYHESAASLIAGFDVLVAPSRFEAFGRAAAEAMHLGVPVVASQVGGLPEVVGDSGILVPPDRPDLLAQEIVGLAGNPALTAELASRARERARELFGLDRMVQDTTAAYALVTQCR